LMTDGNLIFKKKSVHHAPDDGQKFDI